MQNRQLVTVDKWFQRGEIWIALIVAIITFLLGWLGPSLLSGIPSSFVFASMLVVQEIILGAVVYVVRRGSEELERFQTSSQLLSDIERLNDPDIRASVLQMASILSQSGENPMLFNILKRDLERKVSEFSGMVFSESFPMYRVGDHSPIQAKLQQYMGSLTAGCSYVTISNLRFWSGKEISHPLDFLYFNADCANERQVKFQRVFLLDKEFGNLDQHEVGILREHLNVTRKSKDMIETFVVESPGHSSEDLRIYGNFSVWLSADSIRRLLLIMVYNYKTGEFDKLEVTKQQQRIDMYYQRFLALLARSEPIEDYLRKNGVV